MLTPRSCGPVRFGNLAGSRSLRQTERSGNADIQNPCFVNGTADVFQLPDNPAPLDCFSAIAMQLIPEGIGGLSFRNVFIIARTVRVQHSFHESGECLTILVLPIDFNKKRQD